MVRRALYAAAESMAPRELITAKVTSRPAKKRLPEVTGESE